MLRDGFKKLDGVLMYCQDDLSDHIGMRNKGTFFMVFTLSSIVVRIWAGKASDKYGRVAVLKVSTTLLAISMIMIAASDTKMMLIASGVVFGLAAGINSPSIFAWTIDLSDEHHRGRGLSTMFIALEIGIGAGAFSSGWIYGNNIENLPVTFVMGAILSVGALIYIQFIYKKPVPAS